jgi:hypothetical protein
MKRILFVAFALLFSGWIQAQEYRHLDQVQELPNFGSVEQWLGRASYLRDHILSSAGLLPLSERSPLNAQVMQAVAKPDYQIQNLVLETLPDFYLVGNIYRPVGQQGPFPAVLSPPARKHAGGKYSRQGNFAGPAGVHRSDVLDGRVQRNGEVHPPPVRSTGIPAVGF